jgi:putative endonuclease
MWYTYVLFSLKSKRLYIGYTGDLRRRITEHNNLRGGNYTSKNAPFKLIHYEAFLEKVDAQKQEIFYKSGYGREVLKGKIKNSLEFIKKDL